MKLQKPVREKLPRGQLFKDTWLDKTNRGKQGGVRNMKESYLAADFRKTVAQRFAAQEKQLNAAFDARLQALLAETAGESKEKRQHLRRQILPGIAAYETLQSVMPKDEALRTVHGYVEQLARRAHKTLAALLRVPGLYRLVPGIFVKSTRTYFGPASSKASLAPDGNAWQRGRLLRLLSENHGLTGGRY